VRIVLDTNVLISGIFFGGVPGRILNAWSDEKVKFVLSLDILKEYYRVAQELSKKFKAIDVSSIIDHIAVQSEVIQSPPLPKKVCKDKDDDKFISCALTGKVRYIVTGDKGFLSLSNYLGIQIITPRQFADKFLKHQK
jgi:putative PIN family toxin of toxin-antitoxin system